MTDNVKTIIALAVLVSLTLGFYTFFAKASDLKAVSYKQTKQDMRNNVKWAYYELDNLFRDHGMRYTRNCDKLPITVRGTCIRMWQDIKN